MNTTDIAESIFEAISTAEGREQIKELIKMGSGIVKGLKDDGIFDMIASEFLKPLSDLYVKAKVEQIDFKVGMTKRISKELGVPTETAAHILSSWELAEQAKINNIVSKINTK